MIHVSLVLTVLFWSEGRFLVPLIAEASLIFSIAVLMLSAILAPRAPLRPPHVPAAKKHMNSLEHS